MELRIIAGTLGRRRIQISGDATGGLRPTVQRVRGAVAEIVKTVLDGAEVADICAGTGALGFELLSRGAAFAQFVEPDRALARAIDAHARLFGVQSRVRVACQDVRTFIRRSDCRYDIIYYDPPFDDAGLCLLAPDLLLFVKDNGMLIHERRSKTAKRPPPEMPRGFLLSRTCEYGDTAVDFYMKKETPVPSFPLLKGEGVE